MVNVSIHILGCAYAVIALSYWLEQTGRCPISVILNLRIGFILCWLRS
jgi:hypothetical protein